MKKHNDFIILWMNTFYDNIKQKKTIELEVVTALNPTNLLKSKSIYNCHSFTKYKIKPHSIKGYKITFTEIEKYLDNPNYRQISNDVFNSYINFIESYYKKENILLIGSIIVIRHITNINIRQIMVNVGRRIATMGYSFRVSSLTETNPKKAPCLFSKADKTKIIKWIFS